MLNLGVIPVDVTARFYFSTAAADGGEEDFSATLEEADIVVMKDGAAMTLDASTITVTNITTGVYELDIDQTNDADFTAGSTYWVYVAPSDETIDSQAVSAVLGCWSTETASQRAVRLLQSRLYPGAVITTTTSNGVAAINLTDIVDAQTDDDSLIGQLLLVRDATDGALIWVTVTDLTSLIATVALFPNGGNMPITVASGDEVYIMGPVYSHALGTQAKADVNAEADTALTDYDPPTKAELDVLGTGALATAAALAVVDGNVDDIETAAAAIQAQTDQFTFSAAGFVDVNVMEVNDNGGLVGDGDGTPIGTA
jgi:hypothetical protein